MRQGQLPVLAGMLQDQALAGEAVSQEALGDCPAGPAPVSAALG